MTDLKCPENAEGLEELEKLIPLCRKEIFQQVKAKVETQGISEREASRLVAEELKKPIETIRTAVKKEKINPKVGQGNPSILTESDQRFIIKEAKIIREEKKKERDEKETQLKENINIQSLPSNKYQTIVIDPPWPVKKILRDERPNQAEFNYPTMSIQEITKFDISSLAHDNCHIYLWTTHKFLPLCFDILIEWGFKYQCLLTWIKNVGMTPFSWMYSTEHCLFGRKGNLPLLQMGKRLDFNAKVREHSRKPEIFYELVKEVSPEPRIDIFSREKREGFDQYGNETERF